MVSLLQKINLGGCMTAGIIAHEIGHALGFLHEQSRPDRDDHVQLSLVNVDPTKKHNFDRAKDANVC